MSARARVPTLLHELRILRRSPGLVAGVDEVGRGPLAGPVLAAAVILPLDDPPGWVHLMRDSKALTAAQRECLAKIIRREATAVAIAAVISGEIDRIGIAEASRKAMRLAVQRLPVVPDHVLVDGLVITGSSVEQTALVRGDSRSLSVAAASIVAKVARDGIMNDFDTVFPGYGFIRHKGYGTPEHLQSLRKLGPSMIHRRTFLGEDGKAPTPWTDDG